MQHVYTSIYFSDICCFSSLSCDGLFTLVAHRLYSSGSILMFEIIIAGASLALLGRAGDRMLQGSIQQPSFKSNLGPFAACHPLLKLNVE